MADALLDFNYSVAGPDGRPYRARVCGRPMNDERDERWEGWIELISADAGPTRILRTPRETVQPNRTDLEYWATGLTPVYLEGALVRALDSESPHVRVVQRIAAPAFDGPAPAPRTVTVEVPPVPATAVLDPFSVYAKGEQILRQELSALRAWHLRNILRAYALDEEGGTSENLSEPELIERIVAGVQRRLAEDATAIEVAARAD
jgi:hypothetical protein